jgi:hypothetical protein
MTANIIASTPEGERATEIGVGALFGIVLIGALCGVGYYVRKHRTRARLERDTVDMERGIRDGNITTLEVNWEKDPHPGIDKEISVNDGGRDGNIARQNRHHRKTGLRAGDDGLAKLPTYAAIGGSTLECEAQLSKPKRAHVQN